MRILVKIGGALLEEPAPRAQFAQAVQHARALGHEVLIVHGGGSSIRSMAERLGLAEKRVDGLRVTDAATAEVVQAVLAGTVNKNLVMSLNEAGVNAVGLTGADGRTWSARKHTPGGADLGFVGRVDQVRPNLFHELLANGYVPTVASVAPPTPGTESGPARLYNVNADQAAGPLAVALRADALLFLTDVAALLDDAGAPVREATPSTCAKLERDGVLQGGMRPKVQAALAAANANPAALVKIASGSGTSSIADALESGTGTRFLAQDALRSDEVIHG